MNEKQQILEIIDGFKNLTSKIKKDNDEIKGSLKNKELTIAACKKEYKKLFEEHEELKRKYVELVGRYQNQNNEKKSRKRRNQLLKQKKNKKKIILDYNDDYDDDDDDDC